MSTFCRMESSNTPQVSQRSSVTRGGLCGTMRLTDGSRPGTGRFFDLQRLGVRCAEAAFCIAVLSISGGCGGKLQQYEDRVEANDLSFTVGNTGLLGADLRQLTGGEKIAYSPELARQLNERERQLEEAGQIPSSPRFSPSTVQPFTTAINPPFDWQQQITKPAFDWRNHRTLTPAKSQGGCGACWAFAAASLAESFVSVFYRKSSDFSEQDIIDCAPGGCGGGFLSNALARLEDAGVAPETSVGYVAAEQQCRTGVPRCYSANFHNFVDPNWGIPENGRMKKAIYQYGGMGAYIIATDLMLAYRTGVYDEFATAGESHFVVIVGWDDNKQHSKGRGAWLIKNSWGQGWGENGFGWVAYGANEIGFNAQIISVALPGAGCP